jgi:hypothetical protein
MTGHCSIWLDGCHSQPVPYSNNTGCPIYVCQQEHRTRILLVVKVFVFRKCHAHYLHVKDNCQQLLKNWHRSLVEDVVESKCRKPFTLWRVIDASRLRADFPDSSHCLPFTLVIYIYCWLAKVKWELCHGYYEREHTYMTKNSSNLDQNGVYNIMW